MGKPFPNRILVFANSKYLFDAVKVGDDLLKIIRTFKCRKIATIYLTAFGAIGFEFHDGEYLSSIEKLDFQGDGLVPEEVMKNEDEIKVLQENRMQFVNFIVAALFGRISAKRNTGLGGALYNGQDKITAFHVDYGVIRYQRSEVFEDYIKLKMKQVKSGIQPSCILKGPEIKDAVRYARGLWERQYEFEYADLVSCMVMNYQAAVLHNQQHSAGSLALNFSVLESLIKEIFYFYGLVGNGKVKPYARKKHNVAKVTKRKFNKLSGSIGELVKYLNVGGLIDNPLLGRIEDVRKKRNNLMHKGQPVHPDVSGQCQTVVRDLWEYLIDQPFELNAGWSYRL